MQSCHAAIEAAKAYPDRLEPHPHLVLCAVENEQELQNAYAQLTSQGIRLQAFREPDIGNQLTAIASEPLAGEARRAFRHFKLLSEKLLQVA